METIDFEGILLACRIMDDEDFKQFMELPTDEKIKCIKEKTFHFGRPRESDFADLFNMPISKL